jgi:hypothetical protein
VKHRSAAFRKAFTLTELLLVIGLLVLLIAIVVPAFSSILYSSEQSLAENQLKVGLSGARDTAIRSDVGDSAAVFSFGRNGRITITPCVKVGEISDPGLPDATAPTVRDVFVPVTVVEPIQLPKGWSVRGFAAPNSLRRPNSPNAGFSFYENIGPNNSPAVQRGNWIFPETSFYGTYSGSTASTNADQGNVRQTFMVRFADSTGTLDTANTDPAIVVDPSDFEQFTSATFRASAPFNQPGNNLLDADELKRGVRRIIDRWNELTVAQQRLLLGDSSVDTVVALPVIELALYEERRLIRGIGARGPNRVTGNLYGNTNAGRTAFWPEQPTYDTTLFPGTPPLDPEDITVRINSWIEGTFKLNAADAAPVESDARIFTLQRSLGQLQELKP